VPRVPACPLDDQPAQVLGASIADTADETARE